MSFWGLTVEELRKEVVLNRTNFSGTNRTRHEETEGKKIKKIAVSLLALAVALFLAVPAMADFEPYGSLRLMTGWYDYEANDTGGADDEDLAWEVSDISRFGARFKTGDLGGRVEFGIKGDGRGDNGVYTRLL